jgi:hypothetical protein
MERFAERFGVALREVAGELDVPPPVRAQILLELAGDLEEAYTDFRSQGLGEEDAELRAREAVLGPPDMVRQLARLHARTGIRPRAAATHRVLEGVGMVLLLLAVIPLLLATAWGLGPSLFPSVGSPLVGAALDGPLLAWPLLAVTLGVVLVATAECARLVRGGMPRRSRLASLLVLTWVAPALGALSVVTGLHAVAMELASSESVAATGGMDPVAVLDQVVRDGSLLAAGVAVGLLGAFSWFGLEAGRARSTLRSVEGLLSGDVRGALPPREIIPLITRRKS